MVPPRGDQRLGGGGLDRRPTARPREPRRGGRDHGEVGRGAVGVDVREAAGHAARAADLGERRRLLSRTAATNCSNRSHVIAVSKVSAMIPAATQRVAQVGRLQERAAPGPGRRSPSPRSPGPLKLAPGRGRRGRAHSSSARAIHALERVVGRLEPEHEQRPPSCGAPVSAASPASSSRQFDGRARTGRAPARPRAPVAKSVEGDAGGRLASAGGPAAASTPR